MKQLTTFILIALFLSSCSKKPIIIGDYSCENRVTFEQLRENPEPYLEKEICFEVGRRNVIQQGDDVTDTSDRMLAFRFKGQKKLRIEEILNAYQNGDTTFLPDIGSWHIHYNSILPIELTRYDDRWKGIEKEYSIPDEYIDIGNQEFIYNNDNSDSLIFSGVLFRSNNSYTDSSQMREFRQKFQKPLAITYNSVYLTGIKIIPR